MQKKKEDFVGKTVGILNYIWMVVDSFSFEIKTSKMENKCSIIKNMYMHFSLINMKRNQKVQKDTTITMYTFQN